VLASPPEGLARVRLGAHARQSNRGERTPGNAPGRRPVPPKREPTKNTTARKKGHAGARRDPCARRPPISCANPSRAERKPCQWKSERLKKALKNWRVSARLSRSSTSIPKQKKARWRRRCTGHAARHTAALMASAWASEAGGTGAPGGGGWAGVDSCWASGCVWGGKRIGRRPCVHARRRVAGRGCFLARTRARSRKCVAMQDAAGRPRQAKPPTDAALPRPGQRARGSAPAAAAAAATRPDAH
jgi:hypothetical protein